MNMLREIIDDCLSSDELLMKHIKGDIILGVYPLLEDNTCWFLAFDFDNHNGSFDPLKDVLRLYAVCEVQGIPCYVLRSKSGTGYHVYIFFNGSVPAWKARLAGLGLLQEAQVVGNDVDISSFDRLFPGQDELTPQKPLGNLIALPFQGRAAKAGHTLFLDPDTKFQDPYPDQMELLQSIVRATEADLDRLIADWRLAKEAPRAPKPMTKKEPTKLSLAATGGKIPQGRRNDTLLSRAGSLRRRGMKYEEIKEVLIKVNAVECEPPLADSEVEGIAQSICRYPAEPKPGDQAGRLAEAMEAVAGLAESVKEDPGAPFAEATLFALSVIQKADHAEWARINSMLKAAKVKTRDLDKAMKQAQARAIHNGDGKGQPGPDHPYCINDGVLTLRRRGQEEDYLVPCVISMPA